MKNSIIKSLIILFFLSSCTSETVSPELNLIDDITLTQEEIDDLFFLREEEKLARDVYLYSYELYNIQIFKNISNSEQQHMDSVLKLLNTYNLVDPASKIIGVFNNADLQEIYNNLIEKSSISLIDALTVGNIIEDLDINDIAINESRTINESILNVYSALKCGSRNHLRNYNSQLLQNGGLYVPIYISQNEFESIVSTSNEQCNISNN